MAHDLPALIAALDTDDLRVQQQAGNQLIDAGGAAIPLLIAAATSSSPRIRKAVTYILGRSKATPEVVQTLIEALGDPEPKVRKNAAIALGTLQAPAAIDRLAQAIAQETIGWVRPSLILALGAIGGTASHAALQAIEGGDEREREALRKARDRTERHGASIEWRTDRAWQLPLLLQTPVGLERVASDEAASKGFPGCRTVAPGLLACPPGIAPWQLVPTLRCVYGVAIDGGHAPAVSFARADDAAATLAALLRASTAIQTLGDWLVTDGTPVRYRFSIKDHTVSRQTLRTLLGTAREVCSTFGMSDSPSNYDLELIIDTGKEDTHLTIRPSFMVDRRFDYRKKDVGASINPVVAACLARLVRTSETAITFDPTCGSGTLLIERAQLDAKTRLRGLDISSTAVGAARTNVKAARLERRVRIAAGDASEPDSWHPCDEVVANLPWGMRTRQPETDLPHLYRAVVDHVSRFLRSGGRAVLYSANAQLLEDNIKRHRDTLQVEERRRIFSGGLWSTAWILRMTGRT